MKTFLLYTPVWLLLLSTAVYAQDQPLPEKLTLRQAQTIAQQNNQQYNATVLNENIADEQLKKAKSDKIPDIYASSVLHNNLILQSTPIPTEVLDPTSPTNNTTIVRFGTPWDISAGFNLQYDLFNPVSFHQVKEKKINKQLSEVESRISLENLKLNIASGYGAVLIARKQYELAVEDTVKSADMLAYMKALKQEGKINDQDFYKGQMDMNTSKATLLQAKSIYQNAKVALLQDMGYPADEETLKNLDLQDKIETLIATYEDNGQESALALSSTKMQLQTQTSEYQLKSAKLSFAPTLSLIGYFGSNYYGDNLNLFEGDKFYGNSYIGLSLTIPITHSLQTYNSVKESQWRLQQQELRQKDDLAQKQALLIQDENTIEAARAQYLLHKKNMDLAEKNYNIQEALFYEGRLLPSDLSKAKYTYKQEQTNYLQSVYTYFTSLVKRETDAL